MFFDVSVGFLGGCGGYLRDCYFCFFRRVIVFIVFIFICLELSGVCRGALGLGFFWR